MKVIGSLLLFFCGFLCRAGILDRQRQLIELGEELCLGVDLLRRGIFRLRMPLTELFIRCREDAHYSVPFWDGLIAGLTEEKPLIPLWEDCCALLPPSYTVLLVSLGAALHGGDQEELLIQTREELHQVLCQQRQQKAEQNKLVTTLCLSASLLLVIALI